RGDLLVDKSLQVRHDLAAAVPVEQASLERVGHVCDSFLQTLELRTVRDTAAGAAGRATDATTPGSGRRTRLGWPMIPVSARQRGPPDSSAACRRAPNSAGSGAWRGSPRGRVARWLGLRAWPAALRLRLQVGCRGVGQPGAEVRGGDVLG